MIGYDIISSSRIKYDHATKVSSCKASNKGIEFEGLMLGSASNFSRKELGSSPRLLPVQHLLQSKSSRPPMFIERCRE